MKIYFFHFFMALAACTFIASCSNDEVTELSNADTISFSVATRPVSRASNVYCNANMPSSFKVWASFTDGGNTSTYINGDEITLQSGSWVNTTGTRYWPSTGTLDFYAVVNDGGKMNWNNGLPLIEGFDVSATLANQTDLLYAVKTGQSKPTDGSKVMLNFRHALSQVVFRAVNTNRNLYVEVEGVTICNVASSGNYTFATASTDGNIDDHTGAGTYQTAGRGSWTIDDGSKTNYAASFSAVALNGDSSAASISLTDTDETGKAWDNVMMLMPQGATAAWDPESGKPADSTGTYFLVKCKIWNVAGDSHAANDVVLWSDTSGNAADVAIPVSINWEEGKKYVYTFIFGDGNGGYDPEDPKPVLLPITFNVSVDDFVNADNQDIEMDAE